jgi:hypothetical protein
MKKMMQKSRMESTGRRPRSQSIHYKMHTQFILGPCQSLRLAARRESQQAHSTFVASFPNGLVHNVAGTFGGPPLRFRDNAHILQACTWHAGGVCRRVLSSRVLSGFTEHCRINPWPHAAIKRRRKNRGNMQRRSSRSARLP